MGIPPFLLSYVFGHMTVTVVPRPRKEKKGLCRPAYYARTTWPKPDDVVWTKRQMERT